MFLPLTAMATWLTAVSATDSHIVAFGGAIVVLAAHSADRYYRRRSRA